MRHLEGCLPLMLNCRSRPLQRWIRLLGGQADTPLILMALDSNAPMGRNGIPLPHFTPFLSPCSAGVNLFCQDLRSVSQMSNPYVFPPFGLIGPVLKFLYGFKIPFTAIIPEFNPPLFWWPELMARCPDKLCLGELGDMDVLLTPSRSGYRPTPCTTSMWTCRVSLL